MPAFAEKRERMILSWSLPFNKSRTSLGGLHHKCLYRENYYQVEVGKIASPSPGRIMGRKGGEKKQKRRWELCILTVQSCRQVDGRKHQKQKRGLWSRFRLGFWEKKPHHVPALKQFFSLFKQREGQHLATQSLPWHSLAWKVSRISCISLGRKSWPYRWGLGGLPVWEPNGSCSQASRGNSRTEVEKSPLKGPLDSEEAKKDFEFISQRCKQQTSARCVHSDQQETWLQKSEATSTYAQELKAPSTPSPRDHTNPISYTPKCYLRELAGRGAFELK